MLSHEDYKAKFVGQGDYVDAEPNRRFKIIVSAIPAGSRVLDVACGSGTVSAALREKDCDVFGIDIPAAAVALTKSKGLHAVQGDVDSFDSDPAIRDLVLAEYDTVIFSKCLVYLKKKNELMAALRTKSVIVNQRNPGYWKTALKRFRNPASQKGHRTITLYQSRR